MIKLIRFLTCHSNMFSYISHVLHLYIYMYDMFVMCAVCAALSSNGHTRRNNTIRRYNVHCCYTHTHTVFMNMIVVRSMTEKENRREENNNNKKTIIIDTYTRIRTCSVERKHNHETVITAKMLPKSQDHHN